MTQRRSWLPWLGGVAALLIAPRAVEWARLSVEQYRLNRELTRLQVEERRLVTEQERLEHDPTYVEGLIRTTFKYAKPGELVIPLTHSPSKKPEPGNR